MEKTSLPFQLNTGFTPTILTFQTHRGILYQCKIIGKKKCLGFCIGFYQLCQCKERALMKIF